MGKVNCAVIGCSNSTYKLNKWRANPCDIHGTPHRRSCGCQPPFILYCFPSSLRNNRKKQNWINLLKRQKTNKGLWEPCGSDRVCSDHFVDKVPTEENPDPTINLGYELQPKKKTRRTLYKHPLPHQKEGASCSSSTCSNPSSSSTDERSTNPALLQPLFIDTGSTNFVSPLASPLASPHSSEHSYCSTPATKKCESCVDKTNLIDSMAKKINKLTLQEKQSKRVTRASMFHTKKADFSWQKIKTDKKMNYYTGLSSILLFNTIFSLIHPYLKTVRYWRGPKIASSWSKIKRSYRPSTKKILSHKDELLLTLMRLRLGLQNEDLADRFGVSPTVASNTFTTMVKLLAKLLGGALVVWLPRDPIRQNMPENFKKAGHSKCRVIIDCSEIFIERPKSLANQAATWSDYKHHNTFKFLIGITPSGYITFLSECYPGRCSDQKLIKECGFYEGLEHGDEVMADRGFQIKEDLLLKHAILVVPPGARVKSQMTSAECKKTSRVANLRIHVERAINRIKTYRILKHTFPITMAAHIDDILLTCAALCNLKPELISTKNPKSI